MLNQQRTRHVMNPLTACDFYKVDHRRQYPEGTELVYSNFTPRSAHHSVIPTALFTGKVTFFGLQYFIQKFLIEDWNENFFAMDKGKVLRAYARRMALSLGSGSITVDHIAALYDLGYLPITIEALPEGTAVPIGVPCLVMYNTHPDFFWLTNYLETIMSCYLWKATTSATIARHYRILLERHAERTGASKDFVNFQAHDFSFRGLSGPEDAAISGAGHLTSFWGTDTIPAIDLIEDYYQGRNSIDPIGLSVPATEHSVMCMGTKDDEIGTFRRLITQLYPKGIVSIVSDTWDFWKVITEYAETLKDEILAREGKVVFRPDSGDPVEIVCGTLHPKKDVMSDFNVYDDGYKNVLRRDKYYEVMYDKDPYGSRIASNKEVPFSPALKGAVECLWDIFGGTVNEKGFKELNPKVGLIYGDSITLERAHYIMKGLEAKGFASSNIVFGVGSFTYQHVTRDTFGFAMKSTYGVVNGVGREIFKDPITDNGTKKSAKGLLAVIKEDGKLVLKDQQESMKVEGNQMKKVFINGEINLQSIVEIRERVRNS